MAFTEKDRNLFVHKGITEDMINRQLLYFSEGFPEPDIVNYAAIGNGILHTIGNEKQNLVDLYDSKMNCLHIVKFIPASGAATRMFKDMFEFCSDASQTTDNNPAIKKLIDKIKNFAFYNMLSQKLSEEGEDIEAILAAKDYRKIINFILDKDGLNYGTLPKGLIEFHKKDNDTCTPLEEHLYEGTQYSRGAGNKVYLHFTVSPEHRSSFLEKIETIKKKYEEKYDVIFNIGLSEQLPSTDTIAADMNNDPFRDSNGDLLFRPGGHGALIHNLNTIDADLIFIKNIDNVVPQHRSEQTIFNKKFLGGIILSLREKIYEYMKQLEESSQNEEVLDEIHKFINDKLMTTLPDNVSTLPATERAKIYSNRLNRPLRVCGIVKNEGEPGGGPFFVRYGDGTITLQILESAQVNTNNPDQAAMLKNSTHFNPTDLVCCVRDYKGNKFDLNKYIDNDAGFISVKSKEGRNLKALELPGLWNGSMAFWNTVFAEVPAETFNPVKTILDLLREEHQ